MPCVEVTFESYLLLLLLSYDRNWSFYSMLIALGLICDAKEVWLWLHDILSRHHSLLRHSQVMFM